MLFHDYDYILFMLINRQYNCSHEWVKCLRTYELCWFIWPFVDERFESLLHGVDKLLIFQEADVDDVIYLVFKVQQLLHHCFVFFRIDYDCTSKSLDVDFLKQWKPVSKRIRRASHRGSSSDVYNRYHTFMYSIQCCRRTWTPPRTRLKSW